MCLWFHSDGHLDVLLMYEQNQPEIDNGEIHFTECYDIILRNYSNHPIDKLYILAASQPDDPVAGYDFIDFENTTDFDWIFERSLLDREKGIHRLLFPSVSMGQRQAEYHVTMLKPKMETPEWMGDSGKILETALFQLTKMSLGYIKFLDDKQIMPYDPTMERETTYWLRLCFKPKHNFYNPPNIEFGTSPERTVKIQPCIGLCSNSVLDQLFDKLQYPVVQDPNLAEPVYNIFGYVFEHSTKDNTSTSIADYRIALITNKNFLVLNPYFLGPCSYHGIQSLQEHRKDETVARLWDAGYNKFPHNDPLKKAGRIYAHVRDYFPNLNDAQSAAQIAAMIPKSNEYNVSHICEALTKFGFFKRIQKEVKMTYFDKLLKRTQRERQSPHYCYYLNTEGNVVETYEQLLYNKSMVFKNAALRDKYIELLNLLYGEIQSPKDKEIVTRFRPLGFNIQYELVFA